MTTYSSKTPRPYTVIIDRKHQALLAHSPLKIRQKPSLSQAPGATYRGSLQCKSTATIIIVDINTTVLYVLYTAP